MIEMPKLIQTPSPNYSLTAINYNLIFVHMMEGGCAGSVAWLCQPASKASVHFCMSESGLPVYQLVPAQYKAWGQCEFNSEGLSLELPGFTAQGIPDERWRAAAKIVAWLCHAYAIPPVWARGGIGKGVCQHHDLGTRGGGHVDCSPIGSPVWMTFIGYVKEIYDEMSSGPLPTWALHGLPAPHATELPPSVTPTPSHGGANRSEWGNTVSHPTLSNYPLGSMADIQYRLVKLGYSVGSTGIDNLDGPATEKAIQMFQAAQGLPQDGWGPITWAALEKATET